MSLFELSKFWVEFNIRRQEMNKNTYKSADELAWEFICTEMERQYHEPQAILARLAGAEEYEYCNS